MLCELIPGGISKAITAGQATQALGSITPPDAVAAARCELAAAFIEGLRGIDARIRETRKKPAVAVQATGTSLTGLFGVGPVVAAAVIGDIRDVSRFGGRDPFAACNGTAPIEVSSGQRKACRLSRRGNRRLNHAIHMVAVTQVRHRHSEGRAYHDKKLAEDKTPKGPCALKRQISNAIFACLQADARRAAARAEGPGGQPGAKDARHPGQARRLHPHRSHRHHRPPAARPRRAVTSAALSHLLAPAGRANGARIRLSSDVAARALAISCGYRHSPVKEQAR